MRRLEHRYKRPATAARILLEDAARKLERFQRELRIELPHSRFHRRQGIYANSHYDPKGNAISEETFEAHRDEWLPTGEERAYVASLMKPVYEPGKMANWIAPPRKGINGQPATYEYVRV